MIILIDGHNLIPKIRGLSLRQIDDEDRLIELLLEYARRSRKTIHVYFDKAAVGHSGTRSVGTLKVIHVEAQTTADERIIQAVAQQRSRPADLLVVSSDHHIQNQVRAMGAGVMTSEQFVSQLESALQNPPKTPNRAEKQRAEQPLSPKEVDEWLDLFNSGPSEKYSE